MTSYWGLLLDDLNDLAGIASLLELQDKIFGFDGIAFVVKGNGAVTPLKSFNFLTAADTSARLGFFPPFVCRVCSMALMPTRAAS